MIGNVRLVECPKGALDKNITARERPNNMSREIGRTKRVPKEERQGTKARPDWAESSSNQTQRLVTSTSRRECLEA